MPAAGGWYEGRQRFRSILELEYIIFLEKMGYDYQYETMRLPYKIGKNGKGRAYIVDFLVKNDKGEIFLVEVKSSKNAENPNRKLKAKIAAVEEFAARMGYKFEMVTEKAIKPRSFNEIARLPGVEFDMRTRKRRNFAKKLRAIKKDGKKK
jgi:hypothetical protein